MALIKEAAIGFRRINELMTEMVRAAESGDNISLIKFAHHFAEDTGDFVGVLMLAANVTEEQINAVISSNEDEQLIKDAASAEMIKTATVKM